MVTSDNASFSFGVLTVQTTHKHQRRGQDTTVADDNIVHGDALMGLYWHCNSSPPTWFRYQKIKETCLNVVTAIRDDGSLCVEGPSRAMYVCIL